MKSETNNLHHLFLIALLAIVCSFISIALCSCSAEEPEPADDVTVDPAVKEAEQISRQYRFMVNRYLEELVLGEYDRAIAESDYNFIPVGRDEMDYYQFYTGTDLDYYYLRNVFYLGEFTDDEIDYLKARIADDDEVITDEDRAFIQETFLRVISEEVEGIDGVYDMDYGKDSPSGWFAPSDNLVLGFRYDEFNLNGMTDEEWDENLQDQRRFFVDMHQRLIAAIKEKFGWDTTIFTYDDYHVNPLNEYEGARYAD